MNEYFCLRPTVHNYGACVVGRVPCAHFHSDRTVSIFGQHFGNVINGLFLADAVAYCLYIVGGYIL